MIRVPLSTSFGSYCLPCLYSNNSTENHLNSLRFDSLEAARDVAFQLNTQIRKSASCLAWNVDYADEEDKGRRTEERQPHPPAGTRTGAPAVTTDDGSR